MAGMIKLLLVEDDVVDARSVTVMLENSKAARFAITGVDSLSAAAAKLQDASYDVIVLDLGLPDSFELETLTKMVPLAAGVPIIVLSGLEDKEFAAKARKQGAVDYLFKEGINTGILDQALERALAARPAGNGKS